MSIPGSEWRADGSGVKSNGDCGGDIQRGDSYSVRYVRPDMPAARITVMFYAIEPDELPGEFLVQRQVEWFITGPGGDEEWSGEAYDDMPTPAGLTVLGAEREAREYAEAALDAGWTHRWDGQPDYQNGAAR